MSPDATLNIDRIVRRLVPLLLSWFSKNARDLPWRRTRDPYAIWVSEIMLQQTQVRTVLPYYERWLRALPTIEELAKASPDKIHKLWEGLGYYTRVRNLQKAAQLIVAKHGGQFPQTFADVLELPGIGRYTAGAICSIAFNQPTPILDGNIIRLLTRVFGIDTDPREKGTNALLWRLAEALIRNSKLKTKNPKLSRSHLNQSLMELGALICTPRAPQCPVCPVRKHCVAFRTKRVDELPALGCRAPTTARRFVAFVVERDGKFLVRQRPAGVVNALLWEFPNEEIGASPVRSSAFRRCPADRLKAELQTFESLRPPKNSRPLCTIKHSITRYRITLEAHRVAPAKSFTGDAGRWLTLRELDGLAFTSAHKKIIAALADRG